MLRTNKRTASNFRAPPHTKKGVLCMFIPFSKHQPDVSKHRAKIAGELKKTNATFGKLEDSRRVELLA